MRRYFFEAKDAAPEASYKALDFILGLYRVEHDARARGILGTQEHLELRRTQRSAIRAAMRRWLESERPHHAPKSPMGAAIRYAINQWDALGVFLENPNIPLDNNESESALRRVALGRNYAEPRLMRSRSAFEMPLHMNRARDQVAASA